MLIISIVHHGHGPLLPVFDAWHFLHIKKASLVPIEFANHAHREKLSQYSISNVKNKSKVNSDDEDDWPIDRFSTTPCPGGISSLHNEVSLKRKQTLLNWDGYYDSS